MKPLIHLDIYRDNFITFGGLVASSIANREIADTHKERLDSTLRSVFSGKGSEPQIQQRLEDWLRAQLPDMRVVPYAGKRDLYITAPGNSIIEVKHNHKDVPEALDDLPGSPASLSAVQQLFKYLIPSGAETGILTDGMSFRLYLWSKKAKRLSQKDLLKVSKNCAFEPYIEFAVQDIVLAEEATYFQWFTRLLLEPGYLKKLVLETRDLQRVNEKEFTEFLLPRLSSIQRKHGDSFTDSAVLLATLGAIRTLEDRGIFPHHPPTKHGSGFSAYLLRGKSYSSAQIKKSINAFLSAKFLKCEGREFPYICDYKGDVVLDVAKSCQKALKIADVSSDLKAILCKFLEFDFSDLDWNFWSLLYQVNANQEDTESNFGRYYTHPRIISSIVEWFVHKEQRSTKGEKALPIYNPCVGSGNMLRTFLSFAQDILPGYSPIKAAKELVKSRLWGSDIDNCALWICKLSLASAVASRNSKLIVPRVFNMDVFGRAGWTTITQDPKLKFSIVSNPPWKRPKFQLNYLFRDAFKTGVLPKTSTNIYKAYEEFKKIITFDKTATQQYYKIWDSVTEGPKLFDAATRELLDEFTQRWEKWESKFLNKLGLKTPRISFEKIIRLCQEQKEATDDEKAKYSEKFVSTQADSPDRELGDKSCASMFFSRMVRGIPNLSKFAIVQPDSFFVGDNKERREHIKVIERYFCFSKNRIPGTKLPLFSEVHTGMRFGVVLGTKGITSSKIKAVIFRTDLSQSELLERHADGEDTDSIDINEIPLNRAIPRRLGNFGMLPIFDRKESHRNLVAWIAKHKPRTADPMWHTGIDQASSRNTKEGSQKLVASSKALVPAGKNFRFKLMNPGKAEKGSYERRRIPDSVEKAKCINERRVFVADVNRNAPTRHNCLFIGLLGRGVAVFNNILWCKPRNTEAVLRRLDTKAFESALYSICKSNHLNGLALNWLGF